VNKEVPQLYDIPIEELEVWKEANVRKMGSVALSGV